MVYLKISRSIISIFFIIAIICPLKVSADVTQITVTIIPSADSPVDSPTPSSPASSGGWAPHGPKIIIPEFKAPEFVFEPSVSESILKQHVDANSTSTVTTTFKRKPVVLAVSFLPVKIIYDANNPRFVQFIFETDVPTSALIEYGRTHLNETRKIKDAIFKERHEITLQEIEPGETYYFYITVYNKVENWTSVAGGFETYYETNGGYFINTFDSDQLKSKLLLPLSRQFDLESPAAYIVAPSSLSTGDPGTVANASAQSFMPRFFETIIKILMRIFHQLMNFVK